MRKKLHETTTNCDTACRTEALLQDARRALVYGWRQA